MHPTNIICFEISTLAKKFCYIDTKHCKLKQYNNSPALDTKSCKDNGEGVRLSFYWSAFNTEKIVGEKMISTSFDRVAGYEKWAPDAAALGFTLAPPGAYK
jgi:hypothetical protein